MPQLIPLGVAVGGLFTTAAIGPATAFAIGAVTSAVVGAAIGGISAAVMGGDIGKGMLFGAVGGVVTGGLAGGSIVNSFGGAGSATYTSGASGSMFMEGAALTTGGEAGGVWAAGAGAGAAGGGGAGGLLGMSTGAGMLGKAGLDFVAGGMAPEPHVAYQTTQEGQEGQWAHEKEMAKLNASLAGGGGGGGSSLPWSTSEAGVKYQKGMDYKVNKENNAARMSELNQTYKLQRDNTKAEWQLGRDVYDKAAKTASSGGYQGSGAAQEKAVMAKEAAKDTYANGQPMSDGRSAALKGAM